MTGILIVLAVYFTAASILDARRPNFPTLSDAIQLAFACIFGGLAWWLR